jgi:antitoxin YefM
MIGHITNIIKRGVIIMDVVNYTDFRKSLAKYIDKVDTDKGPILITRQNAKPTVLMSLEEFNSYEETLHLLSSPTNAKRLRRSIADAKAGRLIEREIDTKDIPLTFDDEVGA